MVNICPCLIKVKQTQECVCLGIATGYGILYGKSLKNEMLVLKTDDANNEDNTEQHFGCQI